MIEINIKICVEDTAILPHIRRDLLAHNPVPLNITLGGIPLPHTGVVTLKDCACRELSRKEKEDGWTEVKVRSLLTLCDKHTIDTP